MRTTEPTPAPIYLVDESADDLLTMRRLLTHGGVPNRVVAFPAGNSALAQLRRLASCVGSATTELPAAIILGDNVGGVSGPTLLTALRAMTAYATTNVIVLSSSQRERDRVRALELGANAYLSKFPTPTALASAISAPVPLS